MPILKLNDRKTRIFAGDQENLAKLGNLRQWKVEVKVEQSTGGRMIKIDDRRWIGVAVHPTTHDLVEIRLCPIEPAQIAVTWVHIGNCVEEVDGTHSRDEGKRDGTAGRELSRAGGEMDRAS